MKYLANDNVEEFQPFDARHVEELANAALKGMELVMHDDLTTPVEILVAGFAILEKILTSMKLVEDPVDRFENAREIGKMLDELKLEYGQVPN